MDEGSLACLFRLVASLFPFGDERRADLGDGGRDVSRRVVEGGDGVADGDAHDLDASPVSSEPRRTLVFSANHQLAQSGATSSNQYHTW